MRPNRAGDGRASRAERNSSAPPAWLRNVAVWVGAGLAVVVLVVLGVAVLPGWWATQVGSWVQGVPGRGVPLGLGIGAVFTLLPLGVGLLAFRSGLTSKVRIALIVIALLLLLPNVLTIAIALGSSDARSVLAIAAPGFRGATVVGVALVVLVLAAVLVIRRRSRHTRHTIEEAGERAKRLAHERAQSQPGRTESQPSGTEPQPGGTESQPGGTEPRSSETQQPAPAQPPAASAPPPAGRPAPEPRSE
jgi:hypothetical protein